MNWGEPTRSDQDSALGAGVAPEDHLYSLDGTFRSQPPHGATLKDALSGLLDRMFEHRFPAHPIFEQEVKTAALKKVLNEIERAAEEPQQRRFIEDRALRQILGGIAGPVKLGTMGQTHFVLDDHWAAHFTRLHAQQGGGPMTVKRLRASFDHPRPMGLPRDLENLVILAFAAQANRTLSLRGAPVPGTIERLDDDAELREQPLPDEATWAKARERASEVFGLVPSEVRKGATVERLAADLRERAQAARGALASLANALRSGMAMAGVDANTAPRMATLISASGLVTELTADTGPEKVIRALADADLRTSEAAVGRVLIAAPGLTSFLGTFEWDAVMTASGLQDHRRAAAELIGRAVSEALEADEHVVPLETRLREVLRSAYKLLAATAQGGGTRDATPLGGEPTSAPASGVPGTEVIDEKSFTGFASDEAIATIERLRSRLQADPEARLEIFWRLTRAGRPP
jgi:hypothetical protein